MEQYFWLTNQIHGWSWVLRPGVLVIASVILIPLLLSGVRMLRARAMPLLTTSAAAVRQPTDEDADTDEPGAHPGVALALAIVATAAFAYAAWEMTTFNATSRLMPSLAILPGLPLCLWLLWRGIRERNAPGVGAVPDEAAILGALAFYAVAVWAIGFSVPTVALLAWMLLVRAKMRPWTAAIYGGIVFAIIRLLFNLLRGDAPTGALLPLS